MKRVRRDEVPMFVRALITRAATFALLWWALTGGSTQGLWVAVLFIGAATLASFMLVPASPGVWRLRAVIRFVSFFLLQSTLGGIDVSRRALDPRLPIAPAEQVYRLRLTNQRAIVLLADTVSLLPGTVGVELQPGQITLHVLDKRMPVERTVSRLEEYIAAVLGQDLAAPPSTAKPHLPSQAE